MTDKPKNYTVAEVAEIFKRSRRTVYEWIRDGRTFKVVIRVKDGYLIPAEEVERLLSENKITVV